MVEKWACHRQNICRMMRLANKAPHTETVAWQRMASHDVASGLSKLTRQDHGHPQSHYNNVDYTHGLTTPNYCYLQWPAWTTRTTTKISITLSARWVKPTMDILSLLRLLMTSWITRPDNSQIARLWHSRFLREVEESNGAK